MERFLKSKLEGGHFTGVSSVRSRIMQSIQGKSNKSTERVLRLALVRAGISGWRLHTKDIKGCPDFFFAAEKIAVFVDGCFWHGCPKCGHVPRTRSEFWKAKIQRNTNRDRRNTAFLRSKGIRVIRLWEHNLSNAKRLETAVDRISRLIVNNDSTLFSHN
jgi:DNA mismatch endonuclease (patch repair protein)